VVPDVSRLAAAGADAPLAPAEIAEMKTHLAWLRSYKDILRLKLNATEDLLVNGQREPSDRGVCRHLLGKIDRETIEHAVARAPLAGDPAARERMLAGAVRLTADVGVLLAYLETLSHVRARVEAAQAFAEVVRRIDFESLSSARLARLLQVLVETFHGHERVQVLFSLLAQPAFRRAFDAGAASFPPAVADAFAPLRAVHRRLLEGEGGDPPALCAAGLEQVLSAPDPVLRGYPEPLRIGMLELALSPAVPAPLADRAAGVLLASLPRAGRDYGRLSLRHAAQLLARRADDRARSVLEELRRAQPGSRTAERWLAAVSARRLGRVALTGAPPAGGRLGPGFWLDRQRAVWLRTAAAAEAERLGTEASLQAEIAVPGVAAVVDWGVASGIPYVAVASPGEPLEVPADATVAAAAARILRALALAGVTLPDAEPGRFLRAGYALTLADLDGARVVPPEEAARLHASLAIALARRLAPEIGSALADAVDLIAIVRALDLAGLCRE
jgi:hypothetical protein